MRTAKLLFLLVLALALVLTNAALADTITIGIGNSALSGYTGPFQTVNVTLNNSTSATITFTSLTNGGNVYLMGDGGTVGVNVHGSSFSLGTITGSNAYTGFSAATYTNGGAGNEDGFGNFNLTINSNDGFSSSSSTVSFGLTLTSGSWSSAADVLTANGSGYLAATHTFVCAVTCNQAEGALATGFAANGVAASPEPATLALLGAGLLGIGGIRRRFRG